ncbi:hypothetical protein L1987_29929 [Smallanthus sonchifolius]|uniref:Uncharacterized protein n=1 Tax=Smallanthus sonchifolius TaxID=185202 RepID=A0ACB9I205_9ASTR|nr:hypothetical protein L1987_29929 [Smallanthus sonchifolius]
MSNPMRTYRGWSSIEDAKLVEALVNMSYRVKSVIEMEEDVNAEEQEQEQEGDDDFVVDMEDNDDEYISIPSVQVEETSSARTKKRKDTSKSSSMLKSFNDAVSLFADRLRESTKESSEGIKFEMDLERKRP